MTRACTATTGIHVTNDIQRTTRSREQQPDHDHRQQTRELTCACARAHACQDEARGHPVRVIDHCAPSVRSSALHPDSSFSIPHAINNACYWMDLDLTLRAATSMGPCHSSSQQTSNLGTHSQPTRDIPPCSRHLGSLTLLGSFMYRVSFAHTSHLVAMLTPFAHADSKSPNFLLACVLRPART
jgi:hypothetical protein